MRRSGSRTRTGRMPMSSSRPAPTRLVRLGADQRPGAPHREDVDGKGRISIVNLADQTATDLPFDLDVASATWRPNHEQLVVAPTIRSASTVSSTATSGSSTPTGRARRGRSRFRSTRSTSRACRPTARSSSMRPGSRSSKVGSTSWISTGRQRPFDHDRQPRTGMSGRTHSSRPTGRRSWSARFFQSTTRSQVALLPADRRRVTAAWPRWDRQRRIRQPEIHSSHLTVRRSSPSYPTPQARHGCSTRRRVQRAGGSVLGHQRCRATWQRRAP